MLLKSALKIDLPVWMHGEEVLKLFSLIGGEADNPQSLFVGGCVRNAVLKSGETDIDIATKYKPEEIIGTLKEAGIKTIPTGIDHGTVTAVIGGKPFEITTLRRDVATDGRRATVAFTDDWSEDAERRDFTMNTLLADMEGNVFDPLGAGIEDLKSGCVLFVGDSEKRIEEDYLRILRFFRFYAYYGEGSPDQKALNACRKLSDNISSLSRERVTSEFLKILLSDNAAAVLSLMKDNNILGEVIPSDYQEIDLQKLIDQQKKQSLSETISRLFVLSGYKARFYDDVLRLSHAQKNLLIKLEMVIGQNFFQDKQALKKAIFYHGNELLVQGYLLQMTKGDIRTDDALLDIAKNWQAPECPVTGETLLAEGYHTGPDLEQELARRQEEWIEAVTA